MDGFSENTDRSRAAETEFTAPDSEYTESLSEEEVYRNAISEQEDDDYSEVERKAMLHAMPDYVGMTVRSGVAPLEMRFSQINSCDRRLPIAYRSHTFINSVTMGVISPEQYSFAADGTDRGIKLAEWNIVEAMETVKRFEAAGRNIQFVTARCPAKLTVREDFYEWMKGLMEANDFHTPEKLCLEFPQSLLFEDHEATRLAILNMKLLRVRTMMTGCGADDCPVSILMQVPVDMVLVEPALIALLGDRNKGGTAGAFLSYLRSMQIDIIGDGVYCDEQIAQLNRADCMGYIPSSGFHGTVEHGPLRMTRDEAISQRDEEVG